MSEEHKRIAREIVDRLCAETDEPCPGGACTCASFNCDCAEVLIADAIHESTESILSEVNSLRDHLEAARDTNARLNRRCQEREAELAGCFKIPKSTSYRYLRTDAWRSWYLLEDWARRNGVSCGYSMEAHVRALIDIAEALGKGAPESQPKTGEL